MEHGTIMILSIISVAAIAAVIIEYYQTASDKVVGAQCDKSKLVCRVRSETTHFGGYLPTYSYSYIPFPVYGAGLGIYSSGLGLENRSDCVRCLDNVTDRDEKQIITSKSPVPESELSSQKTYISSEAILILAPAKAANGQVFQILSGGDENFIAN